MKTRPKKLYGFTDKMRTGCGNLYVTANSHEDRPFEIFLDIGKAGGCAGAQSEAIGRLCSLILRSDIALEVLIKQIKGIRCHMPREHEGQEIFSCADAVAKALEDEYIVGKD